jgi:hypothetical protein
MVQTECGVELVSPTRVHVKCRKCGETIPIEFGEMTRDQAEHAISLMDSTPRECPGYHVELSGWRHFWRLDEALEAMYGTKENTHAVS